MRFGDGHDCLCEDDPRPNLVDVERRLVLSEFNSAVAKVRAEVDVDAPDAKTAQSIRVVPLD